MLMEKHLYHLKNVLVPFYRGAVVFTLNIDSVLTEDSENYDYLAKLFNLDEPVAVFNENDTDMKYFIYYDTDKEDIRQFNIHNIESIG